MEEKYTVNLHFSGKLNGRQKDEIVERILNALIHESKTNGIVPDDAEEFTTAIIVSREDSEAFLGRDLITGELI